MYSSKRSVSSHVTTAQNLAYIADCSEDPFFWCSEGLRNRSPFGGTPALILAWKTMNSQPSWVKLIENVCTVNILSTGWTHVDKHFHIFISKYVFFYVWFLSLTLMNVTSFESCGKVWNLYSLPVLTFGKIKCFRAFKLWIPVRDTCENLQIETNLWRLLLCYFFKDWASWKGIHMGVQSN